MKIYILNSNELTLEQKEITNKLESDNKKMSFYSSSEWLNVVENKDFFSQRLCIVEENNEIVFSMAFSELDHNESEHYNLKDLLEGYNPYFNGYIIGQNINIDKNVNVITGRSASSADFRYKNTLSINEIQEIFYKSKEYIEKQGNYVCFLYVPQNTLMYKFLLESNYSGFFVGNNYSIKNPTWDNYLLSFSSKKRNKLRKYIKNIDLFNLELKFLQANKENLEITMDMIQNNFKKHGFVNANKDYLRKEYYEILKNLKNNMYTGQIIKDNEVIGASTSFFYKDVLYAFQIGFDYEKNKKEYQSYFLLGIYNNIKLAEQLNAKYIQFYDGLDNGKLLLGLRPEKLFHFVNTQALNIERDFINCMSEHYLLQFEEIYKNYQK